MIRGEVNASLDAVVELAIAGPSGDAVRLPFVVDTGFTGAITLPSKLVAALDLPEVGIGDAFLADGTITRFPYCQATIAWEGGTQVVSVEVAETAPLLGMRLLEGHTLCVEIVPGGDVVITALQQADSSPEL